MPIPLKRTTTVYPALIKRYDTGRCSQITTLTIFIARSMERRRPIRTRDTEPSILMRINWASMEKNIDCAITAVSTVRIIDFVDIALSGIERPAQRIHREPKSNGEYQILPIATPIIAETSIERLLIFSNIIYIYFIV